MGFFDRLTQELNTMARDSLRKSAQPTVAVIDSQSVRTGLAQSVKGLPLPRPIVMHLRPLVSVTMQPHCSLTARTHLLDA